MWHPHPSGKRVCICLQRGTHTENQPELSEESAQYQSGVHIEHLATTAKVHPPPAFTGYPPQVPKVSFGLSAGKGLRAIGHKQHWYPVQLIERSSEWAASQLAIEAVLLGLSPLPSPALEPPKGPG